MKLRRLFVAIGAVLLLGGLAAPAVAQPKHPKAKAAKEKAKAKKEKLKEKHADKKAKHKELKAKHKEKKAEHKALKEKEKAGELTDEEKAQLEKMEKRHKVLKAKHKTLKAKHKKLKKTWKARRRAARKKVLGKYPNIRKHPKAVAEMKKHFRRLAHLKRAKAVAEAEGRDDLVEKIDALIAKENARHQAKVAKFKDKIK
jgi:hypothetical protein